MKILIISNGTIDDIDMLRSEIDITDYIICADGGARYFANLDVYPNIIVGDLDSLDDDIRTHMKEKGIEFLKFPAKKDKTDTELAIDYAIDMGVSEVTLIGVTGTRFDHTLANIMLLRRLMEKNIDAKIVDNHNEIFMIKDELILEKKDNTFVSIVPLTETVKGVTLKGFEYEIYNRDFKIDTSLGISNVITEEKGSISIEQGICLVIRSRD